MQIFISTIIDGMQIFLVPKLDEMQKFELTRAQNNDAYA